MSSNLRSAEILWDAVATTDANGVGHASRGGNIGPQTNVGLFIQTNGACTFRLQAGASKAPSVGRNAEPNVTYADYIQAQVLETASGVEGNLTKIVFGGAGSIFIELSPFSPTFLRLDRIDVLNTSVTVTAFAVAVG